MCTHVHIHLHICTPLYAPVQRLVDINFLAATADAAANRKAKPRRCNRKKIYNLTNLFSTYKSFLSYSPAAISAWACTHTYTQALECVPISKSIINCSICLFGNIKYDYMK